MDNQLLSTERLRKSTYTETRSPKQQFESDRGRILFSAPFRRLQSKAQVFSLESNAAVRSRLTHSIEVAHIGRYLAHKLLEQAEQNGDDEFAEQCSMIEPIVETACLLHDIGNPPFGHLGESAVQDWFRENAEKLYKESTGKKLNKNNGYFKDFLNFDGNPQGARILLTLQGYPDKKGYNLTVAQIASTIKYPEFSTKKNPEHKKISVFSSEKKAILETWRKLGLKWGKRHPLLYLMEAADDIAYCLSDIEDGLEKKVIFQDDVVSHIASEFSGFNEELKRCIPENDRGRVVNQFVGFRTNMINVLVKHAAEYFYEKKDVISDLGIKGIFHKNDDYSLALKVVNDYCKENIYRSQEAEDIEIAGYNIVHGILDKFSVLLSMNEDDFTKLINEKKGKPLQRRMFSKLPCNLVEHYNAAVLKDKRNEWYVRFQLVVDHISGMTDDYALKMFKLLHGIEVSPV